MRPTQIKRSRRGQRPDNFESGQCIVDRNEQANALRSSTNKFRNTYAKHIAILINERPTAIARRYRGIRLDKALLFLSAKAAYNTRSYSRAEALFQRCADNEHSLKFFCRCTAKRKCCWDTKPNLYEGYISALKLSDHVTRNFKAVIKNNTNFLGITNNVCISQKVAIFRDEEARAMTLSDTNCCN